MALLDALPDGLEGRLRRAGRIADALRLDLYLVGGVVRDLLLGSPKTDVDLVVEGDAIKFGLELAKAFNASVTRHIRFGTATLVFPDGDGIDVVTARAERYDAPAALPVIEPGILRHDLRRRDFTINAIAVRLNAVRYGAVVDPFHGRDDLRRRVIRILHPRSFIDDPTRLFRAIRLEQRLGFKLEEETERLFRQALTARMLDRLSGRRLQDQLRRVCEEDDPWPAAVRLDDLGVFQAVHPAMTATPMMEASFEAIRRWLPSPARRALPETEPWLLYLIALFAPYDVQVIRRVIERLHPQRRVISALEALPAIREMETRLAGVRVSAAEVYQALKPLPFDIVLFAGITGRHPAVRQRCRDYLSRYRHVRRSISGHTLREMGVPQGRLYGRILDAVFYAKLNGEVGSANEERRKAEEMWKIFESTGEKR